MKLFGRIFFTVLGLCLLLFLLDNSEKKVRSLRITIETDEFKNVPFTDYDLFYQHLSDEMGRHFEIDFVDDRNIILERLKEGSIDLAYMQGYSFMEAHLKSNAVPLVLGKEESHDKSIFFVNNASPLTDIQELPGKRIAFVSQYSTGGHIMPRFFLNQIGLNPENTALEVLYADDHFEAFEWLSKELVDIVVCDAETLHRMEEKGFHTERLYRPIGETTPYPSHVWVVPETMPKTEQDQLRQAFLILNSDHKQQKEILGSLKETSFHTAKLADFEQLKSITQALNLLDPKPEVFALKLGVHPYLPTDELQEKLAPLAHYLESELGMRIHIEVAKNYEEFIDYMENDLYHIVLGSPYALNIASKRHSRRKTLLGKFEKNGTTSLKGAVIVRAESTIHFLDDLRGKTFAFGDPGSTLSYLFPVHYLCKNNFPMSDFANYAFLGNQRNVALAVLNGEFDAGAVREDIFQQYQGKGLKKLGISFEVQEDFFAVNDTMPKSLRAKVEAAFDKLHKNKNLHGILRVISKDATGLFYAGVFDYFDIISMRRDIQECGTELIGEKK